MLYKKDRRGGVILEKIERDDTREYRREGAILLKIVRGGYTTEDSRGGCYTKENRRGGVILEKIERDDTREYRREGAILLKIVRGAIPQKIVEGRYRSDH